MAPHDVQVVLREGSGLPKYDFVNTLHFEVNAPDTLAGLADGIAAAYAGLNTYLTAAIVKATVKIYDAGPNPGGPAYSKDYATVHGGPGYGPSELACCLSYATVDDPDASLPRRRGRIYVGPFADVHVKFSRPQSTLIGALLDFGEALASVGTAGNTTWLMRSQRDNAYAKIESIWVDDAWDVQRRRGADPSARTVRDVQ